MLQQHPTYKYSEEDVKNELVRFVQLHNPDGYPFDNYHTHEYNEILVFIKGGGIHNISFQNYAIQDYSIHLLAAHDLHWVERDKQSFGFAIVYKEQLLHKLALLNTSVDFIDVFSNSQVINLSTVEKKNFDVILQELFDNANNPVYMLNLAGTFLTKIATSFYQTSAAPRSNDPIISEVITLVEEHFKQHLSLTQYAAFLHMAEGTLHKHIKKVTGQSLHALLQKRLLKEAKRLLADPGSNVGSIAFELGFKEVAHFTNWFGKQTGIPPSGFKK